MEWSQSKTLFSLIYREKLNVVLTLAYWVRVLSLKMMKTDRGEDSIIHRIMETDSYRNWISPGPSTKQLIRQTATLIKYVMVVVVIIKWAWWDEILKKTWAECYWCRGWALILAQRRQHMQRKWVWNQCCWHVERGQEAFSATLSFTDSTEWKIKIMLKKKKTIILWVRETRRI